MVRLQSVIPPRWRNDIEADAAALQLGAAGCGGMWWDVVGCGGMWWDVVGSDRMSSDIAPHPHRIDTAIAIAIASPSHPTNQSKPVQTGANLIDLIASQNRASHRIASHRIASYRTASHRIAAHRTASHRTASHRIAAHRRAEPGNRTTANAHARRCAPPRERQVCAHASVATLLLARTIRAYPNSPATCATFPMPRRPRDIP